MKQIKIILLLFLGVYVSSCSDFLSPEPLSAITTDSYFANDTEIQTGVINMYAGIQGINSTDGDDNHGLQLEYQVTEIRSDNTKTKSREGEPAQFEEYNVDPTNGTVANYYASYYNIIYRANTVLENLDNASDAMRPRFEAEAKFVRAFAYFNLVRLFGDIPLIDRVVSPLEKDIQFTRVSESEIYNLITSDLQTAVAGLGPGTYTRASKPAAQALLAKVYLTLGDYIQAENLCLAVMGSGYILEPEFKDVFYTEGNREVIWVIDYISDDAKNSQNYSAEWQNAVGRSSGLNYPTDEVEDFFATMGGNRTPYSFRIDPKDPLRTQVAKYLPNGDESLGIVPSATDPRLAGNDWIVLRYADVLLMYVEAIIGSSESTADASALDAFNRVRLRADMPTVAGITKQDLLDERRAELAFENQRFYDLVRFDVAGEVLAEYSNANGYGFSPTDLLLPIPQVEIGLSSGALQQNPGY